MNDVDRDELNIRREMTKRRSRVGRTIDWAGAFLTWPWMLLTLLVFHVGWIVVNTGGVVVIPPWDPPPFRLLATIASVEGPFISLLILLRQQRDARINELRQETQLQVALRIEHEASASVQLLAEVQRHLDVPTEVSPQEIEKLVEKLYPKTLMEHLRRELDEAEGTIPGEH